MFLTHVFTLHLFMVIACLIFYILDVTGRKKKYSTPKAGRYTVYISLMPGLIVILMLFINYDYLVHKDDKCF